MVAHTRTQIKCKKDLLLMLILWLPRMGDTFWRRTLSWNQVCSKRSRQLFSHFHGGKTQGSHSNALSFVHNKVPSNFECKEKKRFGASRVFSRE